MATTKTLTGQVAQILNAKEIVINLGREQGVRLGMKFAILTDPLEIKDPATGEVLDLLVREKTRVEVKDVRDKIAVCRTYRTRTRVIRPNNMASAIEQIVGRTVITEDSFYVDKGELTEAAPYANEYVKVGDRVAHVEDE